MATVAADWLGHMFLDMAAKYGIPVHQRKWAAPHCRKPGMTAAQAIPNRFGQGDEV